MMAVGDTAPHVHDLDDRLRVPHSDSDLYNPEAYRCPVSTPANGKRPPRGPQPMYDRPSAPKEEMYVAFTNRCQRTPRNVSNGKQTRPKSFNNRQYAEDIRAKGRHYYFIARIQPSLNEVESPVRSKWLNTLCSQPVDEIFVKYKKKLEASLVREAWSTRDVSTPGEKALISAWSCNSSQRSQSCTPSLRTPTPGYSSTTPNSRLSVYSPVKGTGYESDSGIRKREPELSLVPAISSYSLLHKVNTSPRSSISSVNSHIIHNNTKRRTKSSSDIYDKFKREPRRQRKLLPARKPVYKLVEEDTNTEDESESAEQTGHKSSNELEQSTFEVVSFGASSQGTETKTPATTCRYCDCVREKDQNVLPDITAKG